MKFIKPFEITTESDRSLYNESNKTDFKPRVSGLVFVLKKRRHHNNRVSRRNWFGLMSVLFDSLLSELSDSAVTSNGYKNFNQDQVRSSSKMTFIGSPEIKRGFFWADETFFATFFNRKFWRTASL